MLLGNLDNDKSIQRSLVVNDLAEAFLNFKRQQCRDEELSPRTLDGYLRACAIVGDVIGGEPVDNLAPRHFADIRLTLTERLGPRSVGTYIRMIKTLFSWAYDSELLDHPPRYGRQFAPPSRSTIRKAQPRNNRRVYEPDELRRLINTATPRVRVWILLGLNAAFGQKDIAMLPASTAWEGIDAGVLSFPRPKTGIDRDTVLWPETIRAMKATIRDRGAKGEAWLSQRGHRLVRERTHAMNGDGVDRIVAIDGIGQQFAKHCKAQGVANLGFYAMRRTFDTIADRARDPHAQLRVMGHTLPGMTSVYVDRIDADRIKRVCDEVRGWLDLGAGSTVSLFE